jgi:hypothetical protein
MIKFLGTKRPRHQRRARTAGSDKPCMRDMLIARPLHAFVGRVAASSGPLFSFHIFNLLLQLFGFRLYSRLN